MLVLTRKPGETIVVGDDIRITVVSLGSGRVKIGVVAPPSVRVDRQEIHDVRHQGVAPAESVPNPVIVDESGPHNRIAQIPPVEPRPVENRLRRFSRPPFPPRKPR